MMILVTVLFLCCLQDLRILAFSPSQAASLHLYGWEGPGVVTESIESPLIRSHSSITRKRRSIDSEPVIATTEIVLKGQRVAFDLVSTAHRHDVSDECMFHGRSTTPDSSYRIALTGCGSSAQGIVTTATSEFFVVRPDVQTRKGGHLVQKRSTEWNQHAKCGVQPEDDPFPWQRSKRAITTNKNNSTIKDEKYLPDLLVELALFVDDAMWQFFVNFYGGSAEQQIKRFVLASVNNIDLLFGHSGIQPKVRLRIVYFEAMRTPPLELSRAQHKSGEVTQMLEAFCQYQHSKNKGGKWDHALLLSGYDLYRGDEKGIAGFAPVKGMCAGLRSCTINEGLDFGSSFVIAHEMGHSLGMHHDGEDGNACHSTCCIMSATIGTGKTDWSTCSIEDMRVFVADFGTAPGQPLHCLVDDGRRPAFRRTALPGQQFSADEQCAVFHNTCWQHTIPNNEGLSNVCRMLWCTDGSDTLRGTHPALEGTFCGKGRVCSEGACKPVNISLTPVDGGWSEWADVSPCAKGPCGECQVMGQLRVRRSVRYCNKPFKNNGGKDCEGSEVRGLVCADRRCTGQPSAVQYATAECQRQIDDGDGVDMNLSGEGVQFGHNLCKVWCKTNGSQLVWPLADFPDGTPCGQGRFCLRGECMNLFCSNATPTLGRNATDCVQGSPGVDAPSTAAVPVVSTPRPTPGVWTPWSAWGPCSAKACGQTGLQQRIRVCEVRKTPNVFGVVQCPGSKRQRTECSGTC